AGCLGVVRQRIGDAADRVTHVRGRHGQIHAVVELDGDTAAAEGRGRGDRLHARNARHRTLDNVRHLTVDRFGGGTGEIGGDGYDGPIDVRQFAHLHAVESGKTSHSNQRVQNQRQNRTANEERGQAVVAV